MPSVSVDAASSAAASVADDFEVDSTSMYDDYSSSNYSRSDYSRNNHNDRKYTYSRRNSRGRPPLHSRLGGWLKKNVLSNNHNHNHNNHNSGAYYGRSRRDRRDYYDDDHYDDDRSYYSDRRSNGDDGGGGGGSGEYSLNRKNNSRRRSRSLGDPSATTNGRRRRREEQQEEQRRDDGDGSSGGGSGRSSRTSASTNSSTHSSSSNSNSRSRSSRSRSMGRRDPPLQLPRQDDDDDDQRRDDKICENDIHFVESVEDIQKIAASPPGTAPGTATPTGTATGTRKPKTTLIRTDSDLSNVSEKLQNHHQQPLNQLQQLLQQKLAQQQNKVDTFKQLLREKYGPIIQPTDDKDNDKCGDEGGKTVTSAGASASASAASLSLLMTPEERLEAIEELKLLIPKLRTDSNERDLAIQQLKEFEELHERLLLTNNNNSSKYHHDGAGGTTGTGTSSLLSFNTENNNNNNNKSVLSYSSFSIMTPEEKQAALKELKMLLPLLTNPNDRRLAVEQIQEFEQLQQEQEQEQEQQQDRRSRGNGNDDENDDMRGTSRGVMTNTEKKNVVDDAPPPSSSSSRPPLPSTNPMPLLTGPSIFQRTPSIERIVKMPTTTKPPVVVAQQSHSRSYAFTRTPSSERIAQNPMMLQGGNRGDRSSSTHSSYSSSLSNNNNNNISRQGPPRPVDLDDSVLSSPRGVRGSNGGGESAGFHQRNDGPIDLDESVLSSPRGGGYHHQPQTQERSRQLSLPSHGRGAGPVDLDESVISSHIGGGGYGGGGKGGGLIIHRSRSKERGGAISAQSSSSHSRSQHSSGRSEHSSQRSHRSRSSSPSSLKRNLKYSSQSLVDGRWMSSGAAESSVNRVTNYQRRDGHDQYYSNGANRMTPINDVAQSIEQKQQQVVEDKTKTPLATSNDDQNGCINLCGPMTTPTRKASCSKETIASSTQNREAARQKQNTSTPTVVKRSNSTSDLHCANEEFARQQLRSKLQPHLQQREETALILQQEHQQQETKKKEVSSHSSSIFDCIPICGNGKNDILEDDAALTITYNNASGRRRSEPTTFGEGHYSTGQQQLSSLGSQTRSMQSQKSRGEYWNDEDNQSKATEMVENRTKTVAFAEVHDSVETGSSYHNDNTNNKSNKNRRGRSRSSSASRRRSLSADVESDRSPQYSHERKRSTPRIRSESPPRSFMTNISNGLRKLRVGRRGGNGMSTTAQASSSNLNNTNLSTVKTTIPSTLPKSVPSKRNSTSSYGMSTVSSLTFDQRKRRNGIFASTLPKKDNSKRSFKTVDDPSEFMDMDSDTSSSKKSRRRNKKHTYYSGSSFNSNLQSIPETTSSNAKINKDLKLTTTNNEEDEDVSVDAVEVTLSPRAKALLDKKERKRELSTWNMSDALSANVKNIFTNDQSNEKEGERYSSSSTDLRGATGGGVSHKRSKSVESLRRCTQSSSHERDFHHSSYPSIRSDVPRKSFIERVRKGLTSKGRSRSSSSSLAATVGDGSFEIMADAHPRPSNTLVQEFDDSETEQFWSDRSQHQHEHEEEQHRHQQERSSSLPPRHNNERKNDVMKKDIKDVLAMGNKPGALGMPFDQLLREGRTTDRDGDADAVRWETSRNLQQESKGLKKNSKSSQSTTPVSTPRVKSDHSFAGPISVDGSTLGSSFTDDDSTTLRTLDNNTANGGGGVTGWLYNMVNYWNMTSDEKDAEYYYQQGLRDAMKAHRRKLETERQKEIDARRDGCGSNNNGRKPQQPDTIQDAVNAAIKETALLVTNSDMDVVAEIKREAGDTGNVDIDDGTNEKTQWSSKSSKSSNAKKTKKNNNKTPMTKLEYKLFMDNLKNKAGNTAATMTKVKPTKSDDKYNVGVEDETTKNNPKKSQKKDKYAVD